MHDDIDAAAADWLAALTSAIMISSNTVSSYSRRSPPSPPHSPHVSCIYTQ